MAWGVVYVFSSEAFRLYGEGAGFVLRDPLGGSLLGNLAFEPLVWRQTMPFFDFGLKVAMLGFSVHIRLADAFFIQSRRYVIVDPLFVLWAAV
jgi:hypothetical protein